MLLGGAGEHDALARVVSHPLYGLEGGGQRSPMDVSAGDGGPSSQATWEGMGDHLGSEALIESLGELKPWAGWAPKKRLVGASSIGINV